MKRIFLLILFSFTFVDQLQASNVCQRFFGLFQRSPLPAFKNITYDPLNADQQLNLLLNDGVLREIKKSNPNKTHIPFFVPYIEYAISRLEIPSAQQGSLQIREAVRVMIDEAQYKIAQNRVNYFWVLDFSSRAVAIFDGKVKQGFRNLDGMKKLFPHSMILPTFADLDFSHFIRVENTEIALIGMTVQPRAVDGTPIRLSAEQFADHDFVHYMLNLKSEKVLSQKNWRHRAWQTLHQKIQEKIQKLPESKKRYTEFIYFYALHESYGMREAFTEGFLRKNLAAAVRKKYREQDLKDFFAGNSNAGKIRSLDLYQRMYRQDDFMEAFPNKNPQEVLLVGLESFIHIANEIDLGI